MRDLPLLAALALCGALAACGQKGPLYLPDEGGAEVPRQPRSDGGATQQQPQGGAQPSSEPTQPQDQDNGEQRRRLR